MQIGFDRLKARLRQFGGWRLVWQYAKMGVLWTGVKELAKCALHGHSFKSAYPVITRHVDESLLRQYHEFLDVPGGKYGDGGTASNCDAKNGKYKPKIAWVIWLQGFDNAPEIVRACVKSQQKYLSDYEFRLVSENDYGKWITLPQHIEEKRQKGMIPDASFSDLLRLELLVKYGGLYMDASVLCTGFGNDRLQGRWAEIEGSELFFFRYFRRGEKSACGLSNWFFSANPGNVVLSAVRNALFAYWRDYNCLVDYYIMHLFLAESQRHFPELWDAMPRGNSYHSILLGNALAKDFNRDAWQDLTDHVSFHKLNFRKASEAARNKDSYYSLIVNRGVWRVTTL